MVPLGDTGTTMFTCTGAAMTVDCGKMGTAKPANKNDPIAKAMIRFFNIEIPLF